MELVSKPTWTALQLSQGFLGKTQHSYSNRKLLRICIKAEQKWRTVPHDPEDLYAICWAYIRAYRKLPEFCIACLAFEYEGDSEQHLLKQRMSRSVIMEEWSLLSAGMMCMMAGLVYGIFLWLLAGALAACVKELFSSLMPARTPVEWVKKRLKSTSVSMPWSIPPALLVLWSVVWMFHRPQEGMTPSCDDFLNLENKELWTPDGGRWPTEEMGPFETPQCPDIDVLDNSTHLPAELRSSLINTAQAVNDYGNDNNNNIEREPSLVLAIPPANDKTTTCPNCRKEVSKSNLAKHKKSQACRLTHGTNSPDNNDVPMAVSSTTLPGVGHMQSKARMKRRRRENTDDDDDDDDDDDGATHQELKRLRQDLSEERRRHAETMEEVQKLKRALQEANDNSKEEKRQLGVLLETVRNLSGIVLRMGGSNSGVVGQHEGTF